MRHLPQTPAHPAASYAEALERIALMRSRDTAAIAPVSRLCLLTHQRQVARAIVFLHGYTNSPRQFQQLGAIFYAQGYNVLIPRAPYHGLADRMTKVQTLLTPADLIRYVSEAIDVAHGLGQHVTVLGLSMGGIVAGWAAQYRADLDQALIIAPNYGLPSVPQLLLPLLVRLTLIWPNRYRWWDKQLQANAPGPQHAYPCVSTHALARIIELGLHLQAAARRRPPSARQVWMVTNANDTLVPNPVIAQSVQHWRKAGAHNVFSYEFPANLRLPHDLIDPDQPTANTAAVYPLLFDLVEGRIGATIPSTSVEAG